MSFVKMSMVALSLTTLCVAGCSAAVSSDELDTQASALGETGMIRGLAGKCLDVQWASTAPGTPVWLWPCTNSVAQQWHYTGAAEIRGIGDNCLDVRGGSSAAGTIVQIYPCSGNLAQKWNFAPGGRIESVLSGQCLDVQWANSADGTTIWTWPCASNPGTLGTSAQLWSADAPVVRQDPTTLFAGGILHENEQIISPNGRYRLVMQNDCNLVLAISHP